MNKSRRYAPEVRERAVPMVFEHERQYGSQGVGDRVDRGEDGLHAGVAASRGATS